MKLFVETLLREVHGIGDADHRLNAMKPRVGRLGFVPVSSVAGVAGAGQAGV